MVTRRIRLKDPFHLRCVPVHLASLVELKRKSDLFHAAHSLVDAYPSLAVSWFAVGCYYYCIARFDAARRAELVRRRRRLWISPCNHWCFRLSCG